jgi:ATP-dependent DNA ligase
MVKWLSPPPTALRNSRVVQKVLRFGTPLDKLVMYAFDHLYLNGYDMRKAPLSKRKAELAALIHSEG